MTMILEFFPFNVTACLSNYGVSIWKWKSS